MPYEISEELTRNALGLSIHEWNAHSPEEQGRMMATHEIQNKLELLERYESALERNKKNAASTTPRKGKAS